MMSRYTTRQSILPDISKLHRRLRKPDQAELEALNLTPRSALTHGYTNGRCFTGLVESSIICMYGVVQEGKDGRIWMLSSSEIDDHKFGLCRHSKRIVDELKLEYRMLFNVVDERNEMTIKWLQWLGFTLGKTHQIGTHRQPFKEFYIWPSPLD